MTTESIVTHCNNGNVNQVCYWCDIPLTNTDEKELLPGDRGFAHKKCSEEWYNVQIADEKEVVVQETKPAPTQPKTEIFAGDWFSNEHGNVVTVMAVTDSWCMVKEDGKNKPYVLPTEFVLATFNP